MVYFNNITSYNELKTQYRALATINHPDLGGNSEIMKAINNEYDMLFPIWKTINQVDNPETAQSTRSEFYTQNGWKGEKYDINQSLKDIAICIRTYVKEIYPTYKFSITTGYASMCQELYVSMMEAPHEIHKKREDWTHDDIHTFINRAYKNNWSEEEQAKEEATAFYNDKTAAMMTDINNQVNSYNFDDSDAMIDYFNNKFHFQGCRIGKWDKPFKVVEKQERIKNQTKSVVDSTLIGTESKTASYTYDIKQDVDTRDNSIVFVVKIIEKLSKDEYTNANRFMKSAGSKGYSRFKHGFLFTFDPTKVLEGECAVSADILPNSRRAAQKNIEILAAKISRQIESNDSKIAKLSGSYQTNTYKRMQEQEYRELKIRKYQLDSDILNYLLDRLGNEKEPLTTLENAIISNGSLRNTIDSYYKSFETDKREINYPEINPLWSNDNWYNFNVPKSQKRLNSAGITSTKTLIDAVEEYGKILDIARKPIDQIAQKIKKLERECKMMQKGDINFTPPEVACQLVELAKISCDSRVLEPSAGIGTIADEIRKITQHIDVAECMSKFKELLQLKGYNLVGDDFLEYHPEQPYDSIIMNPPFSDEQNHVKHAYSMLADGGVLVSITSPHWTFANDKKSVKFRNWLEQEAYYTQDISPGTFEMTNVSAKILVIEKH